MFGTEMSGTPADFESKGRHWIHSWFFPVFVTSPSQVLDNHLLCGGRLDVWYRRHLHSWDRGQLMAGEGVRGEEVQWQVRSPTPRRHLECLVTRRGLQVGTCLPLEATCKQRKSTGMSGHNEDRLKISKEGLLFWFQFKPWHQELSSHEHLAEVNRWRLKTLPMPPPYTWLGAFMIQHHSAVSVWDGTFCMYRWTEMANMSNFYHIFLYIFIHLVNFHPFDHLVTLTMITTRMTKMTQMVTMTIKMTITAGEHRLHPSNLYSGSDIES